MAVISRSRRRITRVFRGRVPGGPLAVVAAVVLTLGAAACASSPSPPPSAVSASGGPKPSATLITADEIARVNVLNGFEVVQKLRPTMLRQRQIASANGQGGVARGAPPIKGTDVASGQLVVYMDGTRLGDIEQLRGIAASSIATLRLFSPSEAQQKWGSNHPAGAIEVISKN
jgi:hypothetical protein